MAGCETCPVFGLQCVLMSVYVWTMHWVPRMQHCAMLKPRIADHGTMQRLFCFHASRESVLNFWDLACRRFCFLSMEFYGLQWMLG